MGAVVPLRGNRQNNIASLSQQNAADFAANITNNPYLGALGGQGLGLNQPGLGSVRSNPVGAFPVKIGIGDAISGGANSVIGGTPQNLPYKVKSYGIGDVRGQYKDPNGNDGSSRYTNKAIVALNKALQDAHQAAQNARAAFNPVVSDARYAIGQNAANADLGIKATQGFYSQVAAANSKDNKKVNELNKQILGSYADGRKAVDSLPGGGGKFGAAVLSDMTGNAMKGSKGQADEVNSVMQGLRENTRATGASQAVNVKNQYAQDQVALVSSLHQALAQRADAVNQAIQSAHANNAQIQGQIAALQANQYEKKAANKGKAKEEFNQDLGTYQGVQSAMEKEIASGSKPATVYAKYSKFVPPKFTKLWKSDWKKFHPTYVNTYHANQNESGKAALQDNAKGIAAINAAIASVKDPKGAGKKELAVLQAQKQALIGGS